MYVFVPEGDRRLSASCPEYGRRLITAASSQTFTRLEAFAASLDTDTLCLDYPAPSNLGSREVQHFKMQLNTPLSASSFHRDDLSRSKEPYSKKNAREKTHGVIVRHGQKSPGAKSSGSSGRWCAVEGGGLAARGGVSPARRC